MQKKESCRHKRGEWGSQGFLIKFPHFTFAVKVIVTVNIAFVGYGLTGAGLNRHPAFSLFYVPPWRCPRTRKCH